MVTSQMLEVSLLTVLRLMTVQASHLEATGLLLVELVLTLEQFRLLQVLHLLLSPMELLP